MQTAPRSDALEAYERAPLTARYWLTFGLLSAQLIFELFDFFIAGFLISALAPLWKLTFFQTACMLLSTGLGAMVGASTLGKLADSKGRKLVIIVGGLLCSLCSGAVGLIGDGQWILFALLRFFVGVGYGAAGIAQFSLIIELTPTRRRTLLASAAAISPAIGLIFASSVASALFEVAGWRGLALASGAPFVMTLVLWAVIPESFRWLLTQGRKEEARGVIRWLTRGAVGEGEIVAPQLAASARAPLSALYRQKRNFWVILSIYFAASCGASGVYLWGPTVVSQLLAMTPAQAAGYFSLIGIAGLFGRITATFAAQQFGRKRVGVIAAFCGGALLAAAGVLHTTFVGPVSLFLVCLIASAFFFDGAFANLQPYAGELYPVRLGARAMGLSQVGSGAGKLAGPAILALLAGSANFITPHAVAGAVTPGFVALGAILTGGGVILLLIGREPHGAALTISEDARKAAE